jgi:hypothetical protein
MKLKTNTKLMLALVLMPCLICLAQEATCNIPGTYTCMTAGHGTQYSPDCGNGTWTRSSASLPKCGQSTSGSMGCPSVTNTCTWTATYTWAACPTQSGPVSDPGTSSSPDTTPCP